MSVKRGTREFADHLTRADIITVDEGWNGWWVYVRWRSYQTFTIGPFRYKRDAVAWLTSWISEPRPLRNVAGEPGLWVWSKEPLP